MNPRTLFVILGLICSIMAGYADGPFREHRFDSFKVLPVSSRNIVFVGNSISDMHPWVEAWGNDPRVINRGNSGALSSEILRNARTYCAGHPAKIFLMIGTNDIVRTPADTIALNIEKTLRIFRHESPNTQIYVESMLPSSSGGRNAQLIEAGNAAIQTMLQQFPEVTYVDLYSLLKGKVEDGGDYSYDHLHLTAAAYQIWLAEIEKHMGGLRSGYPANTAALQVSTGLPHNSFGMRGTYFSMMPIEADDVLFFGDEMVKNGEWQELFRNPHVKNRGTNWGYERTGNNMPFTAADIDCTFAPVAGIPKAQPRQVVLYTGTGEVNGTAELATVMADYRAIVDKLRGYAPQARITLVGLMPTYNYDNARVRAFNDLLRAYAAAADGVEYIDIYSTLATTTGAPSAFYFPANDDYLYGDGYVAVANVLARYIPGCRPVTQAEAIENRARAERKSCCCGK